MLPEATPLSLSTAGEIEAVAGRSVLAASLKGSRPGAVSGFALVTPPARRQLIWDWRTLLSTGRQPLPRTTLAAPYGLGQAAAWCAVLVTGCAQEVFAELEAILQDRGPGAVLVDEALGVRRDPVVGVLQEW